MTRPLTLAAYRALLAEVAGRHGGVVGFGGIARWHTADGTPVAQLTLALSASLGLPFPFILYCGGHVNLSADPDAAIRDLDAARDTLLRAIAARDELAGVVVDVSTRSTP